LRQEIKELTIKGLEGEVQRLVERHRQDLEQAQARAGQQVITRKPHSVLARPAVLGGPAWAEAAPGCF
jgi:hypothetical protein